MLIEEALPLVLLSPFHYLPGLAVCPRAVHSPVREGLVTPYYATTGPTGEETCKG